MRVLVDTYVALWALQDDPRLSARARAILDGSVRAERHLSPASAYEIAAKVSIGKLRLRGPLPSLYAAFAEDFGLVPLAITHAHCAELAALPLQHRDPFDRLLVAQARVDGLTLLSPDPALALYDVPVAW